MKKTAAWLVILALALPIAAFAASPVDLEGVYVEARSAQVFIGGCIRNSEAHTMGREAVMAWRIDRGHIDGLAVDGLSVVAAIHGDENLALNPDAARRTVLFVDADATSDQRVALADEYVERNAGLFGDVVDVVATEIGFTETSEGYRVSAGDEVLLEAKTLHIDHKKLTTCGDSQWYEPFIELEDETLGIAVEHAYRGRALNARWSDPDKQSAFFGRFSH